MIDKELKTYRRENNKAKKICFFYGAKFFCFKHTYKIKNKAYCKAFNINPKNLFIGHSVYFVREHYLAGTIKIGEGCKLNNYVLIDYSGGCEIGNNVHISSNVKIYSHDHDPFELLHNVNRGGVIAKKTIINDNVWIGANAIILAGVSIGSYSVIGAGAVVTRDVPPNVIVAGVPAKIIRENIKKERGEN